MRQEGEPSVEEILESIKKVIARDNRETAAAERQRRESVGVREEANDDTGEDGTDNSILELDATEIIEEAAPPTNGSARLLSEEAERAMRESLADLAVLSEGHGHTCGGTSIEGMVREMLKPMLAQWLDRHMPAIVERLVKAEIARIKG